MMKTGIELMAAEREAHFEREGWTEEHDDEHTNRELSNAAVCYVLAERQSIVGTYWPALWGKWWKPTTYLRNLVKAGALLAAEIDRLQRAQEGAELDKEETK